MVRSLAIVLAVVAVVFLFANREAPPEKVREVGYSAQLAQTRATASYDVLAPVGLPSGWKATSARGLTDAGAVTWHLGFVTPAGGYAGLEQSDGPRQRFVDGFVHGAHPAGQVQIGGDTWQRLEGGAPEPRALLRRGNGATTMVVGNAGWAELRELAASLRGR
jgi:hypothetical protein